jgi:hypothetical protein
MSDMEIGNAPSARYNKFAFLSNDQPGFSGATKNLSTAARADQGFSTVFAPRQTEEDFLIGSFKPDKFNAHDVYDEFLLYKEFGAKGFSPTIHAVISRGIQVSLPKFLSRIHHDKSNILQHITPDINFLIEKKECDKLIFKVFQRGYTRVNYTNFFTELRAFIVEIVKSGYYNTDIKIPNLCIDERTGNFLMIDLDPNFVKRIPDEEKNPEMMQHYVNYMIYQVYIYLTVACRESVHFSETGIYGLGLYEMMKFICKKNIGAKNGKDILDPLYMLYWYSSQVNNGEYDDFRTSSNHINIKDTRPGAEIAKIAHKTMTFFNDIVLNAIGDVRIPTYTPAESFMYTRVPTQTQPIAIEIIDSPPQKNSFFSNIRRALGWGKSKKTSKKRKLRTITPLNIENVPFSMSKGAVPVMILKRSPRRGTVLNLRRYKKRRNKTRRHT